MSVAQFFFHECGHSLDLFSAKFDSDKANETMSTIAPKFFNFSADESLWSFLKMQIENDPSFLAKLQKTFGKIKSIDDFIACVKSNVDVFHAFYLMESSAEVWQIFGVALLTNGYVSYPEATVHTSTEDIIISHRLEKPINMRILLLSRMNDWLLSLDLNCLIRGDHLWAKATLPFFHYQLPTEVYDALMNFHGTSWEKYKQKVSSTVSKKDEENAN